MGARDNGPARRVFQEPAAEDLSWKCGGEGSVTRSWNDNLPMHPSEASENIVEASWRFRLFQ